jgi:outer membrane protein assembly factor BamB
LVFGDRLFLSNSGSHEVTALDKSSGKLLWKTPLVVADAGLGGFGLAMAGGRLVVGDAEVYGLDPATGGIAWHFVPLAGHEPGYGRLSSDGTTAFLGSASGAYVYAVDGATGTQRWATQLVPKTGIVHIHNTAVDGGMVFAGFSDFDVTPGLGQTSRVIGEVAALDAASGKLLWLTPLPKPDTTLSGETTEIAVGDGYVFASGFDGTAYVLDERTGAVRQALAKTMFTPSGEAPQPDMKRFAVIGDILVVGSLRSTITGVSLTNFQRVWQLDMRGYGSVNDLVADSDFVYTEYFGGPLSVSRVAAGELVWVTDGAASGFDRIAAAPAIDGDRIYLGGFNDAYAMKRQ